MNESIETLVLDASVILASMRTSIGRAAEDISRPRDRLSGRDYWDVARLLDGAQSKIRISSKPSFGFLETAAIDLRDSLAQLLQNEQFRQVGASTNFVLNAAWPTQDRLREVYPRLRTKQLSVLDAAVILLERLELSVPSVAHTTTEQDLSRLRRILPPQKFAPVQFDVVSGRIVIVRHSSKPHPTDAPIAEAARNRLITDGKRIIDELQRSNCDRRLIETVENIHAQLEANESIIELGITNISYGAMARQFEEELPSAVVSLLHAHTTGVSMYVAQYPEWQQFVENASSTEIDIPDVARIEAISRRIIADLRSKPELADSDVPETLARLNALLANPSGASKRAAYAVLRTIENLVSRIFAYGLDYFDQTAKKTVSSLSSVTAKMIVSGLLALAVTGAIGLAPLSTRIQDLGWLRAAAEIIKKQIDPLIR